jgi:hypothetical protein
MLFLPLTFVFWICTHLEVYCSFYPGIDTEYSPGFSEPAFSELVTGMTIQAVQQKLGTPLYIQTTRDRRQAWSYTLDGKCKWGDWAWLQRQVIFHDGVVIEVIKRVIYN